MPRYIWERIFKQGFWDKWGLDNMKSQSIADTIVWWAWGSGNAGATNLLKKFLAKKGMHPLTRSGIVKDLDELAKNKKKEEKLFDELTAHRLEFYSGLSTAGAHLRGWTNAYNKFTTFTKQALLSAYKDPKAFIKRNWWVLLILMAFLAGIGVIATKLIKTRK